MHELWARTSQGLFALACWAWAWCLVVLGVLVAFEWPRRFANLDLSDYAALACGSTLVAAGLFVCAAAASEVFPKAHPRVTAMFEAAPWFGLAAVLIAGGLA